MVGIDSRSLIELLNSSSDQMSIVGPDHCYRHVNACYAELSGRVRHQDRPERRRANPSTWPGGSACSGRRPVLQAGALGGGGQLVERSLNNLFAFGVQIAGGLVED